MNVKSWDAFVDYFLSCTVKVVPSARIFAYETESCADHLQSYYFKNISLDTVHCYVNDMSLHDPIFFKNHLKNNKSIIPLKQYEISSQYQTFLDQYEIFDNVELIFKTDGLITRGISLIRTQDEGCFTSQELIILESFHALAKHTIEQMPYKNALYGMHSEYQSLTNKEKKVLDLILEGKGNQDIANTLFISLATVKTHLQHIFQKMLVKSKSELILKTISYQ